MTPHERKGRWFAVFVAGFACLSLLLPAGLRLAGGYHRHTEPGARGLDSLVLEGHELHSSLWTRPIDGLVRNLPPGMRLPENPHLSTDGEFVEAVSRGASQGRLDSEGIRSALYALYVGEGAIGFYGLEAESVADAD